MKVLLVAYVLLSIVLVEAIVKKKKEKKMERATNCAMLNLCDCEERGRSKLRSCYDKMEEETKEWFLNCLNECNIAPKLNSTVLDDYVGIVCEVNREEAATCAEECAEKFKSHMTSLFVDPTKAVTVHALNAALGSFSTVVMECETFPGSCV